MHGNYSAAWAYRRLGDAHQCRLAGKGDGDESGASSVGLEKHVRTSAGDRDRDGAPVGHGRTHAGAGEPKKTAAMRVRRESTFRTSPRAFVSRGGPLLAQAIVRQDVQASSSSWGSAASAETS